MGEEDREGGRIEGEAEGRRERIEGKRGYGDTRQRKRHADSVHKRFASVGIS